MTNLHKRRSGVLAIAGIVALVLLYVSCESAPSVPQSTWVPPTPEPTSTIGDGIRATTSFGGTPYYGLATMEELVLRAEVIARVRFRSAVQVVETIRYTYSDGHVDEYVGAVVITFDVLEYLKGSAGSRIEAVVYDADYRARTAAEIPAKAEDFLGLRDKQWDDREAIVFLYKNESVPSTLRNNRYAMGYLRAQGEDAFTISSRWAKKWLPAAAPPLSGTGGQSRASNGTQQFFTDAPSGGASGASGQARSQANTITLDGLKTFISDVEAQVTAGGGTEEYRNCLISSLFWTRFTQERKTDLAAKGRNYQEQFPKELASGSPAGSEVFQGGVRQEGATPVPEPSWSGDSVVKSGRDAALFEAKWPFIATTTRPLPAGEYRFFWATQGPTLAVCDGIPDAEKTRDEVVLTVTPPSGTLHEAFFDPVSLASGVGADSSNGVLNPACLHGGRHINFHHRPQVGERIRRPIPLPLFLPLRPQAGLHRPRRLRIPLTTRVLRHRGLHRRHPLMVRLRPALAQRRHPYASHFYFDSHTGPHSCSHS